MLKRTKGQVIEGFPGRRDYGTKGKPITLRTNYFQLSFAHELGMDQALYRYSITWKDNEMSKIKRRRAVEQILAMPHFQGVNTASDFAQTIVTTKKVNELPEKSHVTLPPRGTAAAPQPARPSDDVYFKMEYGASFSVKDLVAFISSPSPEAHYAGYSHLVQMLNIIMCKVPNEAAGVAKLPNNKFYPHHGHPDIDFQELAGGLVALRGYYASVRPAAGRVLLNLNVTSGAFYQSIPLTALLERFGNPDMVQREIFIRRLKVRYTRAGKSPVTQERSIVGFAKTPDRKPNKPAPHPVPRYGSARKVEFKFHERSRSSVQERKISVFAYFKELGITLQRPDEPVINVGNASDPIYVPMELCTVLPGQPYSKLLSGDQTTDMLRFAARVPNQNATSIAGTGLKLFALKDSSGTNPQFNSIQMFGMQASTEMLTIPGRILPAPEVQYRNDKFRANNGSWNCADKVFMRGGRFTAWATAILNVEGRATLPVNHPVFAELNKHLSSYGVQIGENKGVRHKDLRRLTIENREWNDQVLDEFFSVAEKNRIPLLFIVLPGDDKWLYARIKYLGDTRYGIHTICSIGSKLSKEKGQGMYLGNLALKFNLKGGGINHLVSNTLVNPIDKDTMLVGIDVTHPSPGSAKGAPSIACVVASTDKDLFQWPGSLRKQKGKQEVIDETKLKESTKDAIAKADSVSNLTEMILERLDCWAKHNKGQLPKKILVYRDGVSEGQYKLILDLELKHFVIAFKKKYGAENNHPKMAVIVVGKRHHTRFYATKKEDAERNFNTKPGTVVDRGITGTTYHEFFLQSHAGLQGTVRPAHYVVIKDDIGFNADSLEQITHHLAHMFGRATKAVSIVPPAYYADILAERGRAYLFNTLQENLGSGISTTGSNSGSEWNGEIHQRLKDSFFYL